MKAASLQVDVREAGNVHRETSGSGGSERFFAELPVLKNFAAVARAEHYRELPGDWCVAVADVAGSTAAIAAGKYRDINLVGASAIVAVLNATKPRELPFVFGGDGATICVPESCVKETMSALRGAQRMAREQFGLTLRCGVVSSREMMDAGQRVLVARVQVSESYHQAAFAGGGVSWAERKIKEAERGSDEGADDAQADFSGLECRWSPIEREGMEFVSLLVKAEGDEAQRERVYEEVIGKIGEIYGNDAEGKPVTEAGLHLTLKPTKLMKEAKIQKGAAGKLAKWKYTARSWVETGLAKVYMRMGIRAMGIEWAGYRQGVITNTDSRKFDDVLREVRSGSEEQTKGLRAFLETKMNAGELVYGMHVAKSALMTCLIFERAGDHIHFVDGADGGYSMAATELKKRAKNRVHR